MQIKRKTLLFLILFPFLGANTTYSQENPMIKDSLGLSTKVTLTADDTLKTSPKIVNNTKKDTLKKKVMLEDIIKRNAKGYSKINQAKKEITLYDEAELYYKDIELKAGIIIFNYEKDEVYAGRLKDSLGNYTQYPSFKQGGNLIEPDSIRFNTKTKKAVVWNSKTKQNGLNILAEKSKRENDSVYFMKNARFTTSENLEDPEYYFLARKIKFVPKKKVVTGLTNLYIYNIPTPIGVPFAYFPMSEKSVSGFILPTPGQNNNQGYFLQNGGYYFALSDYYDLALTGDYYTNGSYALRAESSYAKRYKFNGRINIRLENQIQSERGLPDYSLTKNYNIQWSHSQDTKAAANSRFSASVNLGSSQYYRQSLSLSNISSSLNNNLSSSISYNKSFQTVPQVNIAITANHSQNTNTGVINMTLPTVTASVDRIFPFAPKSGNKKGALQNISLQYNYNGKNQITTNDSLFFKPQMFTDALAGMQHTIPLSTNFKVFNYFSINASANYNEVWTFNTIEKAFNASQNKVVTSTVNGFDAYRTYNFNAGIGTTIYGTFNFKEGKKWKAVRHVISPNIGYGYTPSFEQYYDKYAIDALGNTFDDYTRFENSLYGSPSLGSANSLSFNIQNQLEAKIRDKQKDADDKDAYKKVKLLNSFNFSTSYNIQADSLKWQPVRFTGGTNLLNDKMNVNFGANLDPYAIDNSGKRINTYNIDNGGSLFRMTSANLTINYSLDSTGKDTNQTSNQTERNGGRGDDLFGQATDLSNNNQSLFDDKKKEEYENDKVDSFYNTKLPWDLRFAYSVTYNNTNRQNQIINNSLMVSGNIEFSPRWKVGVSSGYDFVQKGITFTNLRFERDLESWRMSFNWVPFGTNTYWGFFIGIKSSILSDIKWEKNRLPDRRF